MKKLFVGLTFAMLFTVIVVPAAQALPVFSFGLHRDSACLDGFFDAPCKFLPIESPCAVPCRAPGIQPQSVPKCVKTACPSKGLPCYGMVYGSNPYPLFR